MRDLLRELGFRAPDLIAAFWGGVVSIFFLRQVTPWQAVGTVIAGTFTGHYLGEYAAKIFGLSPGASAFLVGITAMATLQGVIEAARRWRPTMPGGQ